MLSWPALLSHGLWSIDDQGCQALSTRGSNILDLTVTVCDLQKVTPGHFFPPQMSCNNPILWPVFYDLHSYHMRGINIFLWCVWSAGIIVSRCQHMIQHIGISLHCIVPQDISGRNHDQGWNNSITLWWTMGLGSADWYICTLKVEVCDHKRTLKLIVVYCMFRITL